MQSMSCDKVSTQFIRKYEHPLAQLNSILSEAQLVVAIARKAPRLLELAAQEGIVDKGLLSRVTTERALTFLDAEDPLAITPIYIFDDIFINGTTFDRVASTARELLSHHQVSPKLMQGIILAQNQEAKSTRSRYVDMSVLPISPDRVTTFVHEEVAAFSALGKPYDIDHPIIYIDYNNEDSAFAIKRELLAWFASTNTVSYELQRTFRNADNSVFSNWSVNAVLPCTSNSNYPFKIRVFNDPARCRIVLEPILFNCSHVAFDLDGIFSQDILHQANELSNLVFSMATNKLVIEPGSDFLQQRAKFAWQHYIHEYLFAIGFIQQMRAHRSVAEHLKHTSYLDEYDIGLLLGTSLAVDVAQRLRDLKRCCNEATIRSPFIAGFVEVKELPASLVIDADYANEYEQTVADFCDVASDSREVLEAVFHAQHIAVERPSREVDGNEGRLEFGVSLGYLEKLLKSHSHQLRVKNSHDQHINLHRALDELIDCGVAVPQYILMEAGTNPTRKREWLRAFRVGEPQAKVRAYVVIHALQLMKKVIATLDLDNKDKISVHKQDFEKFLVLCADFLDVFSDPILKPPPNITRGFYLFGARPQVEFMTQTKWLIDWAKENRVLTENDNEYVLHPEVGRHYPQDKSPITPVTDVHKRMARMARWYRSFRSGVDSKQLESNLLVAITTVESDLSFKKSIYAELEGWLFHPKSGYGSVCQAVRNFLAIRNPSGTDVDKLMRLSGSWYNWAKQAASEKASLRSQLQDLIARGDRFWPLEESDISEESSVWNGDIMEAVQKRTELRSLFTNEIFDCARIAYFYSRLLFYSLGVFLIGSDKHKDDREEAEAGFIIAVKNANKSLNYTFGNVLEAIDGITICTSLGDCIAKLLDTGELLTGRIADILEMGRYDDTSTGRIEPTPYFLLMWDVNKSANEPDLEGLTELISKANNIIDARFGNEVYLFDKESADDGNLVIASELEIVLAIAQILTDVLARHNKTLKMGLECTVDYPLYKHPDIGKPWGRAFQHAARNMNFIAEGKRINQTSVTWLDKDEENRINNLVASSSYIVVSETTHRVAAELNDLLEDTQEINAMYKARVAHSYKKRVYLKLLSPTPTLFDES